MNLNDYQTQALTTASDTGDSFMNMMHWALGLNGEAGEVAEKLKKIIRDKHGVIADEDRAQLAKEAGDVLWYLASFTHELGYTLEDVAAQNLAKLQSRQARGVLGGSGDNR